MTAISMLLLSVLVTSASRAFASSSSCRVGPAPLESVQAANIKDLSPCVVSQLCDEKKTFLKDAYANRKSLGDIVDVAAKSPSQVVILGESHAEQNRSFVKMALEKLKAASPPVDCVLFEVSKKKYQPSFDSCNQGGDCSKEALPDFTGVNEAIDQKLKIFAVDDVKDSYGFNFAPDADLKDFVGDVNRRNRVMTNRSGELLKSGQCHREVLVIGAEHARMDKRLTSIPELMAKRDISNYRIEMASPGLNTFGHLDSRWTWVDTKEHSICQDVPGPLGENFGFATSKAAKEIPSAYFPLTDPNSKHSEFTGSWGDYDAVVFLGCKDAATAHCAVDRSDYHLTNPEFLAPQTAQAP